MPPTNRTTDFADALPQDGCAPGRRPPLPAMSARTPEARYRHCTLRNRCRTGLALSITSVLAHSTLSSQLTILRETLSIMVAGGDRSSGSDLPLHSYTEDVRGRRRATTRLTVALPDGRHISPRWSSAFHREADTWRFVSNARLDRSRTTPSADLPRVRPTLNNPTDERSTRV